MHPAQRSWARNDGVIQRFRQSTVMLLTHARTLTGWPNMKFTRSSLWRWSAPLLVLSPATLIGSAIVPLVSPFTVELVACEGTPVAGVRGKYHLA